MHAGKSVITCIGIWRQLGVKEDNVLQPSCTMTPTVCSGRAEERALHGEPM